MSFARFKKETTIKILNGQMAPVYNNDMGIKFHTVSTEKPKYSTTSRIHGTTKFNWLSRNISKTDRDSLYTFFDTTLDHGYDYMSVIDHKKRILFDASWNNWREQWLRMRGGIHSVQYGIESPYVWTPQLFGAYLFEANNYKDYLHSITNTEFTLDDGLRSTNAIDSAINRGTGYGLSLTSSNDSAVEAGAYSPSAATTVSFDARRTYNSISIFTQFKCGAIASRFDLIDLSDGNGNNIRLSLENNSGNHFLHGTVINDSTSVTVEISAGTKPGLTVDTWYDVAITYDSVNSELKVYFAEAGVISIADGGPVAFVDFLDGASSLSNGVASYLASSVYPNQTVYDRIDFLKESAIASLPSGNQAILQNIFFIDDYISSMQFNFLRRLCYMWNTKATGINPV